MDQHKRGIAMVVAAIVGIVVTIGDAVDDGLSVWNVIGIMAFVVVLVYGALYLTAARRAG